MGSGMSLTFTEESEALSDSGMKSVVSEAFTAEHFTESRFWDAFGAYLRGREAYSHEVAYECRLLHDGGVVCVSTLQNSGFDYMTYETIHVDSLTNEALCRNYDTDDTFSAEHLVSTGHIKLHKEPFRIEAWAVQHAGRRAPLVAMPFMTLMLGMLGSGVGAKAAASPSKPGEVSILSDPIDDCDVTAETFLSRVSAIMSADSRFLLQSDGSALEVTRSWFEPVSYRQHRLCEEQNEVVCIDFGSEKAMERQIRATHFRALPEPFRLEMWIEVPEERHAGKEVKDHVAKLVAACLHLMLL